MVREQVKARLERLSTMPMLQVASRLGVTTIQDKPSSAGRRPEVTDPRES